MTASVCRQLAQRLGRCPSTLSEWAVFEFARRVGLGVDVGDLLEIERPSMAMG